VASSSALIGVECQWASGDADPWLWERVVTSTHGPARDGLIQLSPQGCIARHADAWIDPGAARARALITHGHADLHARQWRLLAVWPAGEGRLRQRLGQADRAHSAMDVNGQGAEAVDAPCRFPQRRPCGWAPPRSASRRFQKPG